MISRFSYGHVIETEAILQKPAADNGVLPLLSVDEASLSFTYSMADDDKVYGLGENVRGINKRGWIYQSKCSDEPEHLEDRRSLYGGPQFLCGKQAKRLSVSSSIILESSPSTSDIPVTAN